MDINSKLEEFKDVIEGISDDAKKVLDMLQMSIPVGEAIVGRIVERARQIEQIFSGGENERD
jgi:hypothetical protein